MDSKAQTQTLASLPKTPSVGGKLSQPLSKRECACGGSAGLSGDCEDCQKTRLQRYPKGRTTLDQMASFGRSSQRGKAQVDAFDVVRPAAESRNEPLHKESAGLAMDSTESSEPSGGPENRSIPLEGSAGGDGKNDLEQEEKTTKPSEGPVKEKSSRSDLLIDDEAKQIAPGQMRKNQFLKELREAVCVEADSELASVGRSTEGCPYLEKWIDYYRRRSSQQVERALRIYVPEAGKVSNASDYIPFVAARVRRAVATWATTGEITGVPEGMVAEVARAGALGVRGSVAVGGLVGGLGAVLGKIMPKARNGGVREADHPLHIQSQLGAGHPLDGGVRTRMESAFGHDFSRVRVHSDNRAATLSSNLNARAFTVGNNVAFGAGEYRPGTLHGDALLAHELAHVMQQGAAVSSDLPVQRKGSDDEALEADADASAVGAMLSMFGMKRRGGSSFGKQVMPRLKTGLGLSRCKGGGETRKLTKTDVPGTYSEGDCGAYSWTIQWLIDKASGSKGGYVVQTVGVEYNITDCGGTAVNVHKEKFQEAWPFNPNKTVTKWAETGDLLDDTYTDPSSGKKTKGFIETIASAAYFDGITLPADFKVNNPATQARILPSTTTIHDLKGGTAPIPHNLKATWDCCPDRLDKTKVTKS